MEKSSQNLWSVLSSGQAYKAPELSRPYAIRGFVEIGLGRVHKLYWLVLPANVRFTPESGHRLSLSDARFVPKAVVSRRSKNPLSKAGLFYHLVGNRSNRRRARCDYFRAAVCSRCAGGLRSNNMSRSAPMTAKPRTMKASIKAST
jgi:hypothetical protein